MAAWADRRAFADVVASARAGDESAFAMLWRWLHPPLTRWLTVVAPGHVDDVESEVWLSVTRGLAGFIGNDRDFSGWVFTLARRRSIDLARRRQIRVVSVSLEGVDVVDPTAVSSALIDRTSALDAALALLNGLTPDQREVVALRVIAGMTVRETAEVVDKTEVAVRVLCHRGLRTLAEQLAADEFEERVTA